MLNFHAKRGTTSPLYQKLRAKYSHWWALTPAKPAGAAATPLAPL